ncbi:MAG: serine/threonine-protein kinase [Gemmataceae bacterium]
MSEHTDLPDDAAEILAEFLDAIEGTDDPELLAASFSDRRPDLAWHFREEVKFSRLLRTWPESERPFNDREEFPDFRIIRWIATGGMGVVYEAEQISLGRRVALKVRFGTPSPEQLERFLREQKVLARLHQSHIVPIHVSGQHGGRHYFAMSFIDGVTLRCLVREIRRRFRKDRTTSPPTLPDLVRQIRQTSAVATAPSTMEVLAESLIERPLRFSDRYFRSVAAVMADAAEALDFAHGADVVHRDVKPSNILLDVGGHCWLIDFGLAFTSGPVAEATEVDPVVPTNSLTCGPMGTPGYMAPEQHLRSDSSGAMADLRTDIWGLGATLFELLTLERPFPGRTIEEIRVLTLDSPPQSFGKLVDNVPSDLAAICLKALKKKKEHRYRSAADFAADLRRWLRGEPTSARPASAIRAAAMWSQRNKGWAAAIGASVLVALVMVASWITSAHAYSREEKLRADAAEQRIVEEQWKAKLQERESLIHSVQRMQLTELGSGWSRQAWDLISKASRIRKDDRLRDLAIATLQEFDMPLAKRVAVPGSSIAFDANGRRLAVGGVDASTGRPSSPAFLWDGDSKRDAKVSFFGPVAFRSGSEPVQLVVSKGKFELWDLDRDISACAISWKALTEPAAAALSKDGESIAAVWSNPPQVCVWKVATGVKVASFELSGEIIAFSEDGAHLAAADSQRREIVVWELTSGKLVACLPGSALPVRSLAFGRNPRYERSGLLLAVGQTGGAIEVWDLASRSLVNRYRGSPRDITALAFSPDGAMLCSGGREEVRLWDVATGRLIVRSFGAVGMDYITGIVFRSDGRQIAVSSLGSAYPPGVTLWNLNPNAVSCRLLGLSGQIELIALSPDGKHVAALAQNWEVGVWNLEEQRLCGIHIVPPGGHADNGCLRFSPNGASLVYSCASVDSTNVRLWNVATGKELRRWQLPSGLQNKMAFDSSGDLWHAQVELLNGEPLLGKQSFPWRGFPRVCRVRKLSAENPANVCGEIADFNRYVFRVEMTPDAGRLAIEGRGGPEGDGRWLKVFSRETCRPEWTYATRNTMPFANFTFDASGSCLSYCPDNDAARSFIAEVPSGSVRGKTAGTPMAVSTDCEWSLIPIWNNRVGCFVMQRGQAEPLANLALDSAILGAAIDPRGRLMACGSRQGRLDVCDFRAILKRLESVGLDSLPNSTCVP